MKTNTTYGNCEGSVGHQRVITRVGSWPGWVWPSCGRNIMCPHVLRTFCFLSGLVTSPGPPGGRCACKEYGKWPSSVLSLPLPEHKVMGINLFYPHFFLSSTLQLDFSPNRLKSIGAQANYYALSAPIGFIPLISPVYSWDRYRCGR